MSVRKIIHVDLDAFFAAVEQMDNPGLKGKPVIVGGIGGRGVVSTASYEARKFGIHSAQPISKARRLCPQGVFLRVRMDRYKEISGIIRKILSSYTPRIEPVSIDEAFLDVTGCERSLGKVEEIARQIKNQIKEKTGLSCSVGIAPNKFLAKIASDMDKPDGFVVVHEKEKEDFLTGLPVGKIWGVGKVTEEKLQRMGIYRIEQLRKLSLPELERFFGKFGAQLYNLCRGIDKSPVTVERETKSISSETTFADDIDIKKNRKILEETVYQLSTQVARRLRKENLWARSVELKVRFSDFTTITRSQTYGEVTNLTWLIWTRAQEILNKKVNLSGRKVRLIGVGVFNLTDQKQMELFPEEKQEKLEQVTEKILEKFGEKGIRRLL